jgi:hypothetical protein
VKRIVFVCLLMLSESSLSYGATDCRIVQYPDRTEVVCVGESKAMLATQAFSATGVNQAVGIVPSSLVQIDGNAPYSTVQKAYNAVTNGGDIMITGATVLGPLLANNQGLSDVTFTGGCNSSFTQVPGETTTILGKVVLQQGRVNVNAIKVRPSTAGPSPINLGSAGTFVILAKTGVSTTGTTAISGDIGVSPAFAGSITGFSLIADSTNVFSKSANQLVTGQIFAADYAPPTPVNMTTAISDMETAFTDAAGRTLPDYTELGAGDISGMTLAPGLYKWSSGLLVTNAGVTLAGGANDVWIFQIAGILTVDNSARITLSGGALAKNIFWQVSEQANLGTDADFSGTILSHTLISLKDRAKLTGRALAQTAVTLIASTVTKAP